MPAINVHFFRSMGGKKHLFVIYTRKWRPERNQIAKKMFRNSGAQICGFLGVRICMGWKPCVLEVRSEENHIFPRSNCPRANQGEDHSCPTPQQKLRSRSDSVFKGYFSDDLFVFLKIEFREIAACRTVGWCRWSLHRENAEICDNYRNK